MKKTLLKFTGLMLLLFIGYSGFAQDQLKNVGDSYTYTVVADAGPGTNTYTWTISGIENTDWKVTGGSLNSESVTILWLKPNDPGYTVEFTQEQVHGGVTCSTTKSGVVKVANNFDATIADATSVCGGTTGNTDFTFVVTKAGGNADWSFHYTTGGLGTEISGDVNVTGVDTYNLVISVPNVTDGSDKTFNVLLSNIVDASGNKDTDDTNDQTSDVTLYGAPNTGDINW